MANKKTLVIVAISSVLVGFLAAGFIILGIINKNIEKDIANQIDTVIQSSGLEDFIEYNNIKVDALKGQVTISQLDFLIPEEALQIEVVKLSIKIPITEALTFIKNPQSATVSNAKLVSKQVVISTSDISSKTEIGSLNLELEGKFSLHSLQNNTAEIVRADVGISDLVMMFPELSMKTSAESIDIYLDGKFDQKSLMNNTGNVHKAHVNIKNGSLSLSGKGVESEVGLFDVLLEGNFNQQLMRAGAQSFFGENNTLKMKLEDSNFTLSEMAMVQFQMFIEEEDLKSIMNNTEIKSLNLDMNTSSNSLNVNNLSMNSGLMEFAGDMQMKVNDYGEPNNLVAKLEVKKLHDALHGIIAPFFIEYGQAIPDGKAFTINFQLPENGMFELTVE